MRINLLLLLGILWHGTPGLGYGNKGSDQTSVTPFFR